MDLADALDAEGATVAVVGAGGKKSTMYRLAGEVARTIVTATVRIPPFDPHVARVVVDPDPVGALEVAAPTDWPLGLVPAREGDDRYRGYDPEAIDRLVEATSDATIAVKADGARMREFKAPNDEEPRIPDRTDLVVPVASVHAVGRPLDDGVVHRPERVRALSGLALGEELTPEVVATVLAHPAGGGKDVPEGADLVPILNKVDDADLAETAREVAANLLDSSRIDRVVLTRLAGPDPVVGVVT